MSLISCEVPENNDSSALEDIIEVSRNRIENNFRYKVLTWQGEGKDVDQLAKEFDDLKVATQASQKSALKDYINEYNLEVSLSKAMPSLELMELLILNKIERELYSRIPFRTLKPTLFKVSESDNEVTYNVGLFSVDEDFNPEIKLIFENDTANIDINDNGLGYFTVVKNDANETHHFEGIIQYYDIQGNLKSLPFSY